MSSPLPASTARRHPEFEEVAILLDDEEGVAIKITRRDTGYHTFAIGKMFAKPGGEKNFTSFLSRRHIAGIRRQLAELEDFLDRAADREAPRARSR